MTNWKPIKGYEGRYEISDDGQVRSLPRTKSKGGLLKRYETVGYWRVCLYSEGSKKKNECFVHSLVLEAFAGDRPEGMQAAHLNGNRKDNRIANLSWETPKDNTGHKYGHGTLVRGDDNYNALMTDDKVRELRARYKNGERPKDLFEEYGISRGCGQNIIYGRNWRHV